MAEAPEPQFLYLTTTGRKTGKEHRIEIWFVEHARHYYVMSEQGKSAHWAGNILHNPAVSFSVTANSFQGRARMIEPISEPELAAAVARLMKDKYGWDGGLIFELAPGP